MNSNSYNSNNILELVHMLLMAMFKHQLTIKMYHFQTKSYGAHKTSDTYLATFSDNLDKFMEVAQGIVGKVQLTQLDFSLTTVNDTTIFDSLNQFINILKSIDNKFSNYSELLNIRDEIVADAQQLIYLLSFK